MISRMTADDHPDDIFRDTRMSFGDHLDELRSRLIKALIGVLVCLVGGVILDSIGTATGHPNLGVGKPMLDIITDPVETQVRDFYSSRTRGATQVALNDQPEVSPERVEEVYLKFVNAKFSQTALSAEEVRILRLRQERLPLTIQAGALAAALGIPPEQVKQKEIHVEARVTPAQISYLSNAGETLLGTKKYLTTLSAQEGFVVYFKVSLICGVVLSSPWLLYQFWSFVGAGLYPHEKKYVYVMFWPSTFLFVGGVLLCQFVVLPGAVKALLAFNEFLGFDPDIRLNEWLGLALILPLVFGVSFQTPLVMIFFNRIGTFSAADYAQKWRMACMVLAFLSAVITPTPDIITMLYLFVPMFGLYLAGIAFCYVFPGFEETPEDAVKEEEIAV